MPVSMDQQLKALHQTADEMLSGMQAAPDGARRILLNRQEKKKSHPVIPMRMCVPVFAALVLTVAARLLSGVHWVTDILGGLLISAALLCLATALLQKYSKEKQEGVQ